jgi:hypothetical protein
MTDTSSFQIPFTMPDGTVVTLSGIVSVAGVVITPPAVVDPPPAAPTIPATALKVNALPMTGWEMNHDAGTSGFSVGTTSYPVTAPDGTLNCRLFDFTNTAGGGEIYHFPILKDCTPYKNFCFRFRRTASPTVTNSEHDLEAVDAAGNPLDMATQEDGYNGVFDITESHKWVGVNTIKVNPVKWVAGSWHDDEIYMVDNGDGTVTYTGVTIDGVYYPIGITASDVDNGKWTPKILNLQLQFDTKPPAGVTTGVESKVYCSQCEVDCW